MGHHRRRGCRALGHHAVRVHALLRRRSRAKHMRIAGGWSGNTAGHPQSSADLNPQAQPGRIKNRTCLPVLPSQRKQGLRRLFCLPAEQGDVSGKLAIVFAGQSPQYHVRTSPHGSRCAQRLRCQKANFDSTHLTFHIESKLIPDLTAGR